MIIAHKADNYNTSIEMTFINGLLPQNINFIVQ